MDAPASNAPDPPGFADRFSGVARLYGAAALDRFSRSRVAVVGIGGVGSWAVEALARSGVGRIALVDLDDVCLGNVNRQLHALDGQIGRPKTTAMAERAAAIHPGCEITEIHAFLNEKNAESILGAGFDAVIDAIDHVAHKALLLATCRRLAIPVVSCGAAGGRRDPTRLRIADLARTFRDPLLLAVRKSLRTHHGFPKAPSGKNPPLFGISAVFSDEPRTSPQCDSSVAAHPDPAGTLRLDCQSGYGTTAALTGSFGLAAAAHILEILARRSS